MGLLGDSWDDPRSMATMQLAAGLLSPGSFGQGLGRGLSGYQETIGNAQNMQLRQQQILASQQEQQMRELQMRRTLMQLQEEGQFSQPGSTSGGAPAPQMPPMPSFMTGSGDRTPEQNAAGMGAANAPQPTQQAPQIGGSSVNLPPGVVAYKGMPLERLRTRINVGLEPKDAMELWKAANFGTPFQPGYVRNADGTSSFFGNPKDGLTMDGSGTVGTMPGFLDSQAAITSATKTAEIQATNKNTPVPIDRLDRMPGLSPNSSIDDLLRPKPPAAPLPQMPGVSASQMAAVLADNKSQGSPPFTVNGQTIGSASTGSSGQVGGFKTAADIEAEKLKAAQPINFQTDMLKSAHAQNAATFDKLNDTLRNEAELQNRNQQLAPMLDKIQTGGFAPEERIALGNSLQTSGMVPEMFKGTLSKWIANGDPTTGKVIENQLAAAGIKTMLDTLDKEGKPNRAIFMAIQAAQESVKSGNGTLKEVFALQKQLYDWHLEQQQKMGDALAAPDYNPLTFQSKMARMRNDSIVPAAAAPASGAVDLPSNPTSSSLTVGTAYKLPNGSVGKWDGFKFKGQ